MRVARWLETSQWFLENLPRIPLRTSLDRDAHVRKIPRGARRRASKFMEIKMEKFAFHAFHGKLASAR